MKCSVSSVTARIGVLVEQEMIELDAVVLVTEHDAQHVVDDTTEQRGPTQHRDVSLRADSMTNGEEESVARQGTQHGGPQEEVTADDRRTLARLGVDGALLKPAARGELDALLTRLVGRGG